VDDPQAEDLRKDTAGGEDTRGLQAKVQLRPASVPEPMSHTARLHRRWPVLIDARSAKQPERQVEAKVKAEVEVEVPDGPSFLVLRQVPVAGLHF